jgi:RimJ/RimL family protein N-acetyltransferase
MVHDRPSTSILLALDEQNTIEGMMMTYKKKIVQLRGTTEAAKALLAQLDIEKVEIQGLREHKAIILKKFENVNKTLDLTLMTLTKGEETPHIRHPVERLSTGDAEGIAALMRHGDPEWWGDITAQEIAENMHRRLWLGIKVNNQLVSVGGAALDEWGSNISTVVTHEPFRNKGYATSVVSTLVDQILQVSGLALIHVESDNVPAVKAYKKAGFNPYKRYVVVRAENLY